MYKPVNVQRKGVRVKVAVLSDQKRTTPYCAAGNVAIDTAASLAVKSATSSVIKSNMIINPPSVQTFSIS